MGQQRRNNFRELTQKVEKGSRESEVESLGWESEKKRRFSLSLDTKATFKKESV